MDEGCRSTELSRPKIPRLRSDQTVAPDNVVAVELGLDSVLVTWDSILYTENEGRYEVYRSTTQDGPYYLVGYTSDKSTTELLDAALEPRTYYYVVSTVTEPHSANPLNRVVSEFSDEVSIAMLPVWTGTCTGDNIEIRDVMFASDEWITCSAVEHINVIGPVLVESEGFVEFEAETVAFDLQIMIERGAVVIVNTGVR